jgi:hypothetical protein
MRGSRHDVCIGFFNSVDRVDFADYHIRERALILDADKHKNVGPSETGMGLLNPGNALKCRDHVLRFSRLDLNQNVRSGCHMSLLEPRWLMVNGSWCDGEWFDHEWLTANGQC